MVKLFILLGIPVITQRRVKRGRSGEGGGRGTITHQLKKIYTTWARILSNCSVFYTPRGGGKTAGFNAPGAFLLSFFGGHLPQTSARSKQYLRVIFVHLLFIGQNFHELWCRKLLVI